MRTEVIACLGASHGGCASLAEEISAKALEAGATWAKWQLISDPERLALDRGDPTILQVPTLMGADWAKVYAVIPRERRMATVFCPVDVLRAATLGIDNLKVSHVEFMNAKFLRLVEDFARSVYVSTAFLIVKPGGGIELPSPHLNFNRMLTVPRYPATLSDALRCIEAAATLGIGYSDHFPGVESAKEAIDRGLPLLEVHVRLDEKHSCPDAAVSKTMVQLKELVDYARSRP